MPEVFEKRQAGEEETFTRFLFGSAAALEEAAEPDISRSVLEM